MLSDTDLRRKMISVVHVVKENNPDCWADPRKLASRLGLQTGTGTLGTKREGLHVENVIIVDENQGPPERILFTWYHEISHHLLREDDELFSELHDRHEDEVEFERVKEWLCNVGAAEFLLDSGAVAHFLEEHGYSLGQIPVMCEKWGASSIACAIQLVALAPHRCLCLIFRPDRSAPKLEYVIRSRTMKHGVSKRTVIPTGHIIRHASTSTPGELLTGKALIPFNNGRRWECDCEAMSLRGWVFALFHTDPPPHVMGPSQLRFF